MKIISLDIETTGLLFYEGHKITEIGCIEIKNEKITNNIFHSYINPKRKIDEQAKKITGLNRRLSKK
ncbi:MAG TPA: exonuclease domain-containing protein [Candidatus Azoamicus sp.]